MINYYLLVYYVLIYNANTIREEIDINQTSVPYVQKPVDVIY